MFRKFFTRFLMRHYKKKEKDKKRYHKHFKFDDGRVIDLYSNELIEENKAQEIVKFVWKNIDAMDNESSEDIRVLILEIMSSFFDFDAMISIKVKRPEKAYEIVIIRNGAIDLRI